MAWLPPCIGLARFGATRLHVLGHDRVHLVPLLGREVEIAQRNGTGHLHFLLLVLNIQHPLGMFARKQGRRRKKSSCYKAVNLLITVSDHSHPQLNNQTLRAKAALRLLDRNLFGSRSNPVCYDFNPARTRFGVSWNIDHGGHDRATCGYGHRAMIVRASVKNMSGSSIGNTHNGIIRGISAIVSIIGTG